MRTIRVFPALALLFACSTDRPGPDALWEADVDVVQAEEVVVLHGPDGAGTAEDAGGRNPTGGDSGAGEDPGGPGRADESGFGRVAGAALDEAGRIHVLDAQAEQVLVFDSVGTPLHALGGPGEGPMEFSRPTWLSVVAEEVSVRDSRGTSTFHASGEWLGRHRPAHTRSIRSWRVGDRGFIEAAIYGAGRERIDPRMTFLLADSGGVVDTLAVGQAGLLYFRTPGMATALATPWCDLVHVAAGTERRILLADGERGTLNRYTWGETLDLEVSWEVAPPGEPVQEERVAELLDELPQQFRDPDEEFVGPPLDARLCGVHPGAGERAWVRLEGMADRGMPPGPQDDDRGEPRADPPEDGQLWRAVDLSNGAPLLDVRFPAGLQVVGFGTNGSGSMRAVGVHADDLGVQSVRVFRIR